MGFTIKRDTFNAPPPKPPFQVQLTHDNILAGAQYRRKDTTEVQNCSALPENGDENRLKYFQDKYLGDNQFVFRKRVDVDVTFDATDEFELDEKELVFDEIRGQWVWKTVVSKE